MAAPTLQRSKTSQLDAPSDAGLHLTVMGPNLFETYPLPVPGRVDIGREDGVDVRIVDGLASRMHARLHVQASGRLVVEDLDSRNGTFVRGERIASGPDEGVAGGIGRVGGMFHTFV